MPEGGGKANTSFSSSGPQRKSYPVQLVVWFIGTKQLSADNQIDGFEPVRGENNLGQIIDSPDPVFPTREFMQFIKYQQVVLPTPSLLQNILSILVKCQFRQRPAGKPCDRTAWASVVLPTWRGPPTKTNYFLNLL